jgi:hypothetical protein
VTLPSSLKIRLAMVKREKKERKKEFERVKILERIYEIKGF